MDSSGIGLVMGRYKLMKNLSGRVAVQNAPRQIKKVMKELKERLYIANKEIEKKNNWKIRH